MENSFYINDYVEKARLAQIEFENYSQEEVDKVVKTIGKAIFDHAEYLASLAIEETNMGVLEDKVYKNKIKAKTIWHNLKGKKSVGIIKRDEETGITDIAKPMGIVVAITPMTNPIVTPMANAMAALKGRNAIIIIPHHRAVNCSTKAVEVINKEMDKLGAPKSLIQVLSHKSRENTQRLIAKADIVIATGGMGLVKSAYSSGKPAIGVGVGNVQCIVDREIDIKEAVKKIIRGRTFDNGITCSSEQSAIVPVENYEEIINEFKNNHCYFVSDKEELERLKRIIFKFGSKNTEVVGKSALEIGKLAGLGVTDSVKMILAEIHDEMDILGKEKMCPVLSLYKYDKMEDAIRIVENNLDMDGKGHSIAIHSNKKETIEYIAQRLCVSRFVVNQTSATSTGGSFYNGFAPSSTLGCGTWGNNSISENLDYKHLINISKIGYFMKDKWVPSDDELWG